LGIETVQKQRFSYLFNLYEKSKGDTSPWFYSIEIGNELNFPKSLTDLITRYLREENLVRIQTYQQTFPKKGSIQSNIALEIMGALYDSEILRNIGKSIWQHLSKEPLGPVPENYKTFKGLVEDRSDEKNRNLYPLIWITHQGVKEVEQAIHNPEKPTLHFNAYIVQNIDRLVAGDSYSDSFKHIGAGAAAGPGATAINNSLIQDSLNTVEKEYGKDTKQALNEVADFIKKANHPSANTLFNTFNQELAKPQKDKSTLKNLWSGIE
jgi:hypothetical protein